MKIEETQRDIPARLGERRDCDEWILSIEAVLEERRNRADSAIDSEQLRKSADGARSAPLAGKHHRLRRQVPETGR
jgi:hypothetical protein